MLSKDMDKVKERKSFLEKNFDIENLMEINIQEYGCEYDEDGEYIDFIEYLYNDFIDTLIKDYNNYLVFVFNGNWLGQNGYRFVDCKEQCFSRSYDCSQYITGSNTNGKILQLKESSHDVPLGHKTLIIGLTDREYEKLEFADFETIENFAINWENKVKEI